MYSYDLEPAYWDAGSTPPLFAPRGGQQARADSVSAVRFDLYEEACWVGTQGGVVAQYGVPGFRRASQQPAHASEVLDLRALSGAAASVSRHGLCVHASGGAPLGCAHPWAAGADAFTCLEIDAAGGAALVGSARGTTLPAICPPYAGSPAAHVRPSPLARAPSPTQPAPGGTSAGGGSPPGFPASSSVSVFDLETLRHVSELQLGDAASAAGVVALRAPLARGAIAAAAADGALFLLDTRAGARAAAVTAPVSPAGLSSLDALGDAVVACGAAQARVGGSARGAATCGAAGGLGGALGSTAGAHNVLAAQGGAISARAGGLAPALRAARAQVPPGTAGGDLAFPSPARLPPLPRHSPAGSTVQVFDVRMNLRPRGQLTFYAGAAALKLDPNSPSTLVLASADGAVGMADLDALHIVSLWRSHAVGPAQPEDPAGLAARGAQVTCLDVSPSSMCIGLGTTQGTLCLAIAAEGALAVGSGAEPPEPPEPGVPGRHEPGSLPALSQADASAAAAAAAAAFSVPPVDPRSDGLGLAPAGAPGGARAAPRGGPPGGPPGVGPAGYGAGGRGGPAELPYPSQPPYGMAAGAAAPYGPGAAGGRASRGSSLGLPPSPELADETAFSLALLRLNRAGEKHAGEPDGEGGGTAASLWRPGPREVMTKGAPPRVADPALLEGAKRSDFILYAQAPARDSQRLWRLANLRVAVATDSADLEAARRRRAEERARMGAPVLPGAYAPAKSNGGRGHGAGAPGVSAALGGSSWAQSSFAGGPGPSPRAPSPALPAPPRPPSRGGPPSPAPSAPQRSLSPAPHRAPAGASPPSPPAFEAGPVGWEGHGAPGGRVRHRAGGASPAPPGHPGATADAPPRPSRPRYEFDYSLWNGTLYAGLDNDLANSYANALLQALYFTPAVRDVLAEVVPDPSIELGLVDELALLARLLATRVPGARAARADNALRFLRGSRHAGALGLTEAARGASGQNDLHAETTKTRALGSRAQALVRFLLETIRKEVPLAPAGRGDPGGGVDEPRAAGSAVVGGSGGSALVRPGGISASSPPAATSRGGDGFHGRPPSPGFPDSIFATEVETVLTPILRKDRPEVSKIAATYALDLHYPGASDGGPSAAPPAAGDGAAAAAGASAATPSPAGTPGALGAEEVRFARVLEGTLLAHTELRAWLDDTARYTPVISVRRALSLPPVLVLNTGDLSAAGRARSLWLESERLAERAGTACAAADPPAGEAPSPTRLSTAWPPAFLAIRLGARGDGTRAGSGVVVGEGRTELEAAADLEERAAMAVSGTPPPVAVEARGAGRGANPGGRGPVARGAGGPTRDQGAAAPPRSLSSPLPAARIYRLTAAVAHVADEDEAAVAGEVCEGRLVAHVCVPRRYAAEALEAEALAAEHPRSERVGTVPTTLAAAPPPPSTSLQARPRASPAPLSPAGSPPTPSPAMAPGPCPPHADPEPFLVAVEEEAGRASGTGSPAGPGSPVDPGSPNRSGAPQVSSRHPPLPPLAPLAGWHVFNDFHVTPSDADEVARSYGGQKLPCVLFYSACDAADAVGAVGDGAAGGRAAGGGATGDTGTEAAPAGGGRPPSPPPHLENFVPVLSDPGFLTLCHAPPIQGQRASKLLPPRHVPLGEGELPVRGVPFGLDAEFVSLTPPRRAVVGGVETEIRPARLGLARVSLVRACGPLRGVAAIDDVIRSTEPVSDHLTKWSGIRPGDLDPGSSPHPLTTLKRAYLKLRYLIDGGAIFVGHGLSQDFRMINVRVPEQQVVDTVELFRKPGGRMLSLRFLASYVLGASIQEENHDSIEDALAALRLYGAYLLLRKSGTFEAKLAEIYRWGQRNGWEPVRWVDGVPHVVQQQ